MWRSLSKYLALSCGILCATLQLWTQPLHDKSARSADEFVPIIISHDNQCVSMFAVLDRADFPRDDKHPKFQNHGLVTVLLNLLPCSSSNSSPAIEPGKPEILPDFTHGLHFDFARIVSDKNSEIVPLKSRLVKDETPAWREMNSTEGLTFQVYGGPYTIEEWKLLVTVSLNGETPKQITLTVPKEN